MSEDTNKEILAELRRINRRYDDRADVADGCIRFFYSFLLFIFIGIILYVLGSNAPIISKLFGPDWSIFVIVGVNILTFIVLVFASMVGRVADNSRVNINAEPLMIAMFFLLTVLAFVIGLNSTIPNRFGPNWPCYMFGGAFLLFIAFGGLLMWILRSLPMRG